MNINQVVCVCSNWFAEIKTGTMIGERGVVPNSDPCQIITPLVLVGLGLGVGEGLGLGNQIAISTRGVIIWQGVENGHNTGQWDCRLRISSAH